MPDDATATPLSQRTVGSARRLWGLVYVRAVAYLAAGVVLFINPDEGLVWLRWLIGLVIFAQGVLLIVEGRPTRADTTAAATGDEVSWRFVVGIVSVAAALVIVLWPSMSARVLYLVVGIWACAAGVSGVIGALRARALRALAWDWQLVNAVLWLVLGVVILTRPTDDTPTIALLLALYLLLAGAVILVGGFAGSTRVRDERTGRTGRTATAASPRSQPAPSRGTASGVSTTRPAAERPSTEPPSGEPPSPTRGDDTRPG
ncbi:DUF308 domain-containing protein [Isoptericola sp. NEAU-Y5]|uniref:DUF308 domain-containing protein n=1 Tax=Isoptericola luteus TaxID=2879484 RepID=A0ABS7ZJW4_9MICO|nr:DUF308 domain-containing protein [Isoptericola sp. NEAU-Y5]MCA5894080.1 DUF308 domain-containing protein [Isoptericola sp. NEAU-Y5]